MPRSQIKLFHVICRKGYEPQIGHNLQEILRDKIEECDYKFMNNHKIDWSLLDEIEETIQFTKCHKKEIEKYKSHYLVITTKGNIVLGFIII